MKRLLSFFLSALALFTALTLASCNEEEPQKEAGGKHDVPNIEMQEGDIFFERAQVADGLGEYDFGGRKLRLVSHNKDDFFVEEEDRNKGNLIADAKFSRNKTAEDRFNFEMEVVYTGTYGEVNEWASKNILAGADEFDLYSSQTMAAGGLVLKNVFLNWYDIPGVDFSKPWWAASNSDELTYDGKCILAISDFNYSAISGTFCLAFNKNLASAYDMGNLYEVVKKGDWTYDYFYNLIKDVYTDTDGSGDKSVGDFYGFEQDHHWGTYIGCWLWAFDNPVADKNEDGVPVVAIKTDKINNIVTTLYDLCYNTKGCYYTPDSEKQKNSIFFERKAIFTVATIGSPTSEQFRNFEDEYGILPLPKWNENQKDYHTMAPGEHNCLAVPKTCTDTEFVGTCIEALSAESYKQVIPTLYEIALKTRYLRDSESKEVLDIVLAGRTYDFGYIYDNWKGFGFMLSDILGTGSSNFESYYAERYTMAKNHFKKITKVFDKLG